ncbi:MAG: hypothetical protein ACI9UV_002136 [Algoriphagus sp.]|jgi:hypothetical protein
MRHMRNSLLLSILVLLSFAIGCTEEESETTILVTEEVLYTSGDQVRLLGRLITNQPVTATDHGFYLSQDANFASPVIISLGTKEGAGRFIGENGMLSAQKKYFAKAFMDIGNGIEFGNVVELETLAVGIDSYSPGFGTGGKEVFILGRNFTKDTKVFFGTEPAQVLEILFESRLRVRIPEAKGSSSVLIRVQSQDQNLVFPINFEYQTGSYIAVAPFPEQVRLIENISFQNGGLFYAGLGSDRKLSFYTNIQSYNPVTNQWKNANFPGSARTFAFATANYLGGGVSELGREPYTMNPSLWRVIPTGFQRLKDLPFSSRESLAAELNGELYVIGGKEGNTQAVRKHNSTSDTWTTLANSPVQFTKENASFVYQNRFYVIASDRVLYAYRPLTDTWDQISIFPGDLGQGYGFGQVIGTKAYVGGYTRVDQIWEMNLVTLNWVSKNPIPGTPQSGTAGSFEKDGFIYIMRQQDINLIGNFPLIIYKFDPNGI